MANVYSVPIKKSKNSKVTRFRFIACNLKQADWYVTKCLPRYLKAWGFYSTDPDDIKLIKKAPAGKK